MTIVIDCIWLHSPVIHGSEAQDDGYVIKKNASGVALEVLENDLLRSPCFDVGSANSRPFDTPRSDSTDGALTLAGFTTPQHGSVALSADGRSLHYSPDPDYVGFDQFSYTVMHANGKEEQAEVFLNVVEPLFALRDWHRVDESSSGNELAVLENDGLNFGGLLPTGVNLGLRILSVEAPNHGGSVTISEDGQRLIYTPAADFEGLESFSYTIEDGEGYQATAIAQVQVTTKTGENPHTWKEHLEQQFLEQALQRWEFGNAKPAVHWLPQTFFRADSASFLLAADVAGFSLTNVQVRGVDEGDVVKTDGEYLYILSGRDEKVGVSGSHELVIVDVRDPSSMSVVSSYAFNEDVVEIYLHGERVTVLAQSQTDVHVTLLDIADRSSPKQISESVIAGRLRESRAVGEFVHVITAAPRLNQVLAPTALCAGENDICFYKTRQQFMARVRDDFLDELLTVETRGPDDEVVEEHGLLDYSRPLALGDESKLHSLSTIVTFNAFSDRPGPVDVLTLASHQRGDFYVSGEAIYVLQNIWRSPSTQPFDSLALALSSSSVTRIDKLSFAELGPVQWSASGSVEGRLLNRFSADEHEGYLRIATTSDLRDASSSLYVLQQNEDRLEVVGSVENLAPGEQIHSVRFHGNRGFVVTFRQVDPLFTFDLSVATDPRLLGELKVTGYSNYLQLIGENHLLGIGREASESGLFQEMQVSLFDVGELDEPKLLHRYSFEGGRRLWSPIMANPWQLGDHHSISYFASHQVLVIPFHTGGWSGGITDVAMRLLRIDPKTGIEPIGQVDFDTRFDPADARSLRIGEVVFFVSPDVVRARALSAPEDPLGEVRIDVRSIDPPAAEAEHPPLLPTIMSRSAVLPHLEPDPHGSDAMPPDVHLLMVDLDTIAQAVSQPRRSLYRDTAPYETLRADRPKARAVDVIFAESTSDLAESYVDRLPLRRQAEGALDLPNLFGTADASKGEPLLASVHDDPLAMVPDASNRPGH